MRDRDGMALIVVLALLALTVVLVVAFSRTMRNERQSSRDYVEQVRTEQLVPVALGYALDHLDTSLQGTVYPAWSDAGSNDVTCSHGPTPCTNLMSASALAQLPAALHGAALTAASSCEWTNVMDGTTMIGRVAFVIVNCSGLLDANVVGGTNRGPGHAVEEIQLGALTETINESTFYADRTFHVRYDTVAELSGMNDGIDRARSLFITSYDPGRDVYFETNDLVGTGAVELRPKLNINAAVASNDLTALITHLGNAGIAAPTKVAWNIVNYIDTDRLPDDGSAAPWLSDAGIEATPLLNEVVLEEVTSTPSNSYRFVSELWYPFHPVTVTATDGFSVVASAYTNDPGSFGTDPALPASDLSITAPIGDMAYGAFMTNAGPVFVLKEGTNVVPVSETHPAWFVARVLAADGSPVDHGPAEDAMRFTGPGAAAVFDPRANAGTSFWDTAATPSLGAMNPNAEPRTVPGQGLPLVHRDGPMQGIGEIGYIYASPADSNPTSLWQSIDILDYNAGAALLDWLTVRETNTPTRGLVCPATLQEDVLKTLLWGVQIGTPEHTLTPDDLTALLTAFQANSAAPGQNFRTTFHTIGQSSAFQTWDPGTNYVGDAKEDALRAIVELLTFRQNLFTVILAAQRVAPDGTTVLAEQRALAIVIRDAYTGRHRLHLLKSLEW